MREGWERPLSSGKEICGKGGIILILEVLIEGRQKFNYDEISSLSIEREEKNIELYSR